MSGIVHPFEGDVVALEHAERVISPAYDLLTPAERIAWAEREPDNFLNVTRSREDLPPDVRPSVDELLAASRAAVQRLREGGRFRPLARPSFCLYRLEADGHAQTGLVAGVPVDALYERVHRHEHTVREREDELARFFEVVGVSSSPINLIYDGRPDIDALVATWCERPPALDITTDDGLRQVLWVIDDPSDVAAMQEAFEDVETLYLTDGHHRAEGARRLAARRRAEGHEAGPHDHFLAAIFSRQEVRILGYHRAVVELGGRTEAAVLAGLAEGFDVTELDASSPVAAKPGARGVFSLRLASGWYCLRIKPHLVPDDVVAALDVSLLYEHALAPVFGIGDERADPRLAYVPGAFGLEELERRVVEGEVAAAIAVHPTDVADLIAVADAGRVMPPKSTWFDPKVRSGVFMHHLR